MFVYVCVCDDMSVRMHAQHFIAAPAALTCDHVHTMHACMHVCMYVCMYAVCR